MKLELVVDRIEGERVVLIDQDQNVFVWPKKVLADNIGEGHLVVVELGDALAAKPQTNQAAAKDILNEILNLDD